MIMLSSAWAAIVANYWIACAVLSIYAYIKKGCVGTIIYWLLCGGACQNKLLVVSLGLVKGTSLFVAVMSTMCLLNLLTLPWGGFLADSWFSHQWPTLVFSLGLSIWSTTSDSKEILKIRSSYDADIVRQLDSLPFWVLMGSGEAKK